MEIVVLFAARLNDTLTNMSLLMLHQNESWALQPQPTVFTVQFPLNSIEQLMPLPDNLFHTVLNNRCNYPENPALHIVRLIQ